MPYFALATLIPAVLLVLGCVWGGLWPLAGVAAMTVLVFALDRVARVLPVQDTSGRGLTLLLGAVHFGLLGLGVWALGGDHLDGLQKAELFVGLGLFFGQVSNSNAHELIHASARGPRRLGVAIYASLFYGHHASAHLRVHHIHAATDADPNSARLGEGFYRFAWRALRGEFVAGLRAETQARARRQTPPARLSHPYLAYIGGAALALIAAYLLAKLPGVASLLGLAAYAQMQLLLSDYVQHYGLRRARGPDGRLAPMGPAHSWNAPHWYSSAMMLNAPRHSDHHTAPARAFPALTNTPGQMPQLPRSLPVMATLALVPPLWRRVMDHRAARWQAPQGNAAAKPATAARAT